MYIMGRDKISCQSFVENRAALNVQTVPLRMMQFMSKTQNVGSTQTLSAFVQ